MVKYQYAKDESGHLVSAAQIAGTEITESYSCVGCGNELIARVNGKVMAPHFAHKVQVECSGETYLHKLAKTTFYETYQECLEKGEPFTIELEQIKECRKFSGLLLRTCNIGSAKKQYDLTRYYSNIVLEKRDGAFIPDLKLSSTSNPDEKIFIEIAVTHFLSQEKEYSGNRIIEIPIEDETDVSKIIKRNLTAADAMFIGFNSGTHAISDSECSCASSNFYCFYIFKSGKCFLDYGPLSKLHGFYLSRKNTLAYSNLFKVTEKEDDYSEYTGIEYRYRGLYFTEQASLARKRGVNIKNCFLCRYHGTNWDAFEGGGVFCKYLKKQCNSNDAVDCNAFRFEKS